MKYEYITFFTDSHRFLYENYLKPSLLIDVKNNEFEDKQISVDGSFYSNGFTETSFNKIKIILDVLEKNEDNTFFLYLDSDILILNNHNLNTYLNEYYVNDVTFQSDSGSFCTGFMLIKNNNNVRELFKKVISLENYYHNDQLALNSIINEISNIKYGLFDYKIYNFSFYCNNDIWDEFKFNNFNIPEDIIAFHANFTIGLKNKKLLLDIAKNNI